MPGIGSLVKRRVPDVYFQRYQEGGSVYNIGDPGPYGELETQEEKIKRMDQELLRMMDEDDTAMSEMFDDINQRTQQDPADGSDTTYGDNTFARQLYEMEQRKKNAGNFRFFRARRRPSTRRRGAPAWLQHGRCGDATTTKTTRHCNHDDRPKNKHGQHA